MVRGFLVAYGLAIAATSIAHAAEPVDAAHALAQKFAQAPAPEKAQRPPLDYEMEMLRRARAEQAQGRPDPQVTPKLVPPPQPNAKAVVPAAAPITVAPATPPTAVQTAPVAKIAEMPPAAAATPAAANSSAPEQGKPNVQAKTETKAAESTPKLTGAPALPASLLLAIETSGISAKSSSAPKFDPILCIQDACYVSAGLSADAVKLAKLDALKLKTTSEASPDSCKDKTGCVFRNVTVPTGAQVNLIELGSASHEPTRGSDAALDRSCKVSDGDLYCENPIATPDFRIWVVPEETARTAGAQMLEEAVAAGLPHDDVARASDK